MNKEDIKKIISLVSKGEMGIDQASIILEKGISKINEIGQIDINREKRTGIPEMIYGEGKTTDQINQIVSDFLSRNKNPIVTRISKEKAQAIIQAHTNCIYIEKAKILHCPQLQQLHKKGTIAILSAGTSDMPVAEEAACISEILGAEALRIFDIGVAGIHRLFGSLETIKKAQAIIIVAGMDGALPSVVGGLVKAPIIAVPTSVGYGTSFNGIAPMLTMLNSCAPGVSVVNIDNGFGAAICAIKYLQSQSTL